jgi:UDP-N-acetylmuramoyl-tripeptide--D-alanyl-D-alanine ligase
MKIVRTFAAPMTFTTIEQLYAIFLQHREISTDTRKILPGSIFFALKGQNFNGNTFAAEALEKGAAYAVIDEPAYAKGDKTLLVEDVLETLQELAHYHREKLGRKGLVVFALTGSNGKTTTKELLARVLGKKFKTLSTEGNLNNHIGVPLTLLRLDETHEMAVIEMGANHKGEIAKLCEIAEPEYGMITNIGLAHLEGFGSPNGIVRGKTELFRYLEENHGDALVLADDERLIQHGLGIRNVLYGTTSNAEVRGSLISADPYVHFEWGTKEAAPHEVQTQLAGAYNLPNLLAACAAGHYFEIPVAEIDEAISSYTPSNNRSQIEKCGSNTVILDCYNANPSSMEAALSNISKMPAQNKILVLGDMFELGDAAKTEHQKVVDFIAQEMPDAITVLVGKLFASTSPNSEVHRLPTTEAATEWIKEHKPENSVILIKGSRGMKMEQVAEAIR